VGEFLTARTALHPFCLLLLALASCAGSTSRQERVGASAADSAVLGEFEDDYQGRHTISPTLWVHHPRTRYHIRHWNASEQYLIAQNDSANPGDPGRWTRIDWMRLPSMPPFAWAFCLSAYAAPSAAAAESTRIARRETPRTGCNGFPFTRMKRGVTGGR
jgi:hypothetical protein